MFIEFGFPLQGKDANFAADFQPPMTSGNLNNVRPYDVLENRARGGTRPGLAKAMISTGGGSKLQIGGVGAYRIDRILQIQHLQASLT